MSMIGKLYRNKKTGRVVKVLSRADNKPPKHLRYQGMRKQNGQIHVPDPKAKPYRIGVARFNKIFESV